MQYKQNQLSVNSDQELPKSGVSGLTPDVSKDVLAKKEVILCARKQNHCLLNHHLTIARSICW